MVFASQQNDLALQIHCVAVDSNLARVLDCQDNQTLRELARSVAQLDQAVRNSRPRSLDVEEADNHVAPMRRPSLPSRRYTVHGFNGSPSIFKAYPAWANAAK
jgi:hypothetical protein